MNTRSRSWPHTVCVALAAASAAMSVSCGAGPGSTGAVPHKTTTQVAAGSDSQSAVSRVSGAPTMLALMTEVIDPAADAIWDAVAVIETADGVEERRPRTDDEWQRVRGEALTLIEAGHWLARSATAGTVSGWSESAQGLVEAGTAAARAADDRRTDALLDAGEHLDRVCDSCHSAYRPPDADGPAATPASPAGAP